MRLNFTHCGSRLKVRLGVVLAAVALSLFQAALTDTALAFSTTLNEGTRLVVWAGSISTTLNPTDLPYVDNATQDSEENSATASYVLLNEGFSVEMDHTRSAAEGSYAESFGYIYFHVDEDISYRAQAFYTVVDPEGRQVYLYSYLKDETLDEDIYYSRQLSESTVNESFALGGSGGDSLNENTGSLSGTLIAGHDYELFYDGFVSALSSPASSATASGTFTLQLPEPKHSLLSLISLMVIAGLAARRRRSTA